MVKGCEVDPALVYDDEPDDIPSNTGGGGGGRTGSGSARPTEQQDGANVTESGKKSLYRLISESHVEVCVLKHCYVGRPRYTIRCVAKHTYFYIGAHAVHVVCGLHMGLVFYCISFYSEIPLSKQFMQ